MQKRLNSVPQTLSSPSPLPQAFVAFGIVVMSCGCSEIAGLQEHQVYPGFPDSASDVRCSTGSESQMDNSVVPGVFVSCDDIADKPQDGTLYYGRPSYTREGNNVRDSITGLVWHHQADTLATYDSAVELCSNLGDGYRLPSRLELISLLDYGKQDTLQDPNLFQGIKPVPYRTSTEYRRPDPQHLNTHWCVDFVGTISSTTADPFPGETRPCHDTNSAGVVCVKDSSGPLVAGPFESMGPNDALMRDTRTRLVWMTSPMQPTSWGDALAKCANAILDNYDDFRLPNAKELATLVDDTLAPTTTTWINPAFKLPEGELYLWSSTPAPNAQDAYALSTSGASIAHWPTEFIYYKALCVRGPD